MKELREDIEITDHTIPVRDVVAPYSFKNEQEKFYNEFKNELCKRMQPVIENLIVYLRDLETNKVGSGKAEVKYMLSSGTINKSMYDILMPGLDSLDKAYTVTLNDSKYFNGGEAK